MEVSEIGLMRHSSYLLAAAFCGALSAMATPAAAITCDGNVQVQRSGERIVTPYCQDGYLAEVAREYGTRTTAREMRWNPSEKERVCRFIGQDNRVRDTCAPYLDHNRRFEWR
jgi:hypothetical protein